MKHDGVVIGALFSRDEGRILSWSFRVHLVAFEADTLVPSPNGVIPARRHLDLPATQKPRAILGRTAAGA
jgi:hypothetical protein